MNIPRIGEQLSPDQLHFLQTFRKSCAHTIIAMLKQSQSGHPGGSLSTIDYLVLLYGFIISQSGEKVVVSNGHISPAVYSTLAEMGYIPKQDVIDTFRQVGSIYEGHITRHVPGVWYGTGPLGVGVSVASGFAKAAKLQNSSEKIYCVIGDGEAQEGQVYEMMHFANKYQLNNLIVFVDYNQVQLSDSLDNIMPIDIPAIFRSAHWHVQEVDGHDYQAMWTALHEAQQVQNAPTIILGRSIMGKGVDFMEETGLKYEATWHGNAPKPDQADKALAQLALTSEEEAMMETFRKNQVKWHPAEPYALEKNPIQINIGQPKIVGPEVLTDCRSAYGNALKNLAELNPEILGFTADLGGSVKTDVMKEVFPERVLEAGIAEQHMVSCSGGLSLAGFVPFCSTFGAFMTSRAKDQARVNDINRANVKMVATHCGLSVGEDGPTHQAIDDMGSFKGFFNTTILEPSDPNLCDHMIRFAAKTYGDFYVRMGRAKIPVITKEDGTAFYDEKYQFKKGQYDLIRSGKNLTVLAAGPMLHMVLNVRKKMNADFEVICMNSMSHVDEKLVIESAQKTGKVLTIEDHNPHNGYAATIGSLIARHGLSVKLANMGVTEYQLSGKAEELYIEAGLGEQHIEENIKKLLS
jgi:transketolase